MAESVFNIHNALRTLFALNSLIWEPRLADSALAFAKSQVVLPMSEISHDGNEAQNLLCVQNPQHLWGPEKTACHWLKSEGHRKLLLSTEISEIGCGIASSGDMTCVVCDYRPVPRTSDHALQTICPSILNL